MYHPSVDIAAEARVKRRRRGSESVYTCIIHWLIAAASAVGTPNRS